MAARDEQTEFSRSETNKSLADERTKTDSHLERRHKEVEGHTQTPSRLTVGGRTKLEPEIGRNMIGISPMSMHGWQKVTSAC
jgi:hypothetical protein